MPSAAALYMLHAKYDFKIVNKGNYPLILLTFLCEVLPSKALKLWDHIEIRTISLHLQLVEILDI